MAAFTVQSRRNTKSGSWEIQNNLSKLRKTRGIDALKLAAEVGVSRQTIYAIEAGSYIPNTVVSLRLARALDTSVEAIFQIEPEPEVPASQIAAVHLLGDPSSLPEGQLLRIVKVNGKLVAVVPDSAGWGVQPSDAVFRFRRFAAARASPTRV